MMNSQNTFSMSDNQRKARSIWRLLINYFLRGLLVLLPIVLTVLIIVWLVNTITDVLHLQEISGKEFFIYTLLVISIILTVGFVTRGVVARQILDFFEGIIEKAPGLSFIFGTTKDMTEAFVGDKKKFTKPVLVCVGDGIYRMGFITQEDMKIIDMPGHSAVYLPYSYGFNGEMLLVEKSKIKPVNAESSHWTKYIISGGVAELGKMD
ncbi:MAG: DUF502 domain-containing protein [Bacteroidetes bacterium]|nr:DUF502 domain-containing protein [Bacteroidota bacterium]